MKAETNKIEINVGGGVLRIEEGEPGYGAVSIDFVVNGKDGKETVFPVVVVESPTDKSVGSPATKVDAVSVYVYGDPITDEWTHKAVIPHDELRAIAECEA